GNRLGACSQFVELFARSVFFVLCCRLCGFGFSCFLFRRPFSRTFASTFLRFLLASIINQFDDGQFGAITGSPSHFYDSGIAAGSSLKTPPKFAEQPPQRGHTGRTSWWDLSTTRGCGATIIARVKERGSLAPQMNARCFRAIPLE